MVHQKNQSPAWRNPAETARRYLINKRKRKLEERTTSDQQETPKKKKPESTPLRNISSVGYLPIDFSSILEQSTITNETKKQEPKRKLFEVPVDLRPGVRIQIRSKKPFPWIQTNRTTAPSAVVVPKADMVAGKTSAKRFDLEIGWEKAVENLSSLAKLQASSMYYQFPDLTPFQIQTFPRLEAQIRGARKVHSLQQLNTSYVENLTAQWRDTFESLYQDWQVSERRSFYLFGHNTTVMFTKFLKNMIILTPTTSGMRNMLREEHIQFTLPLSGKDKQRTSTDEESLIPDNTLAVSDQKNENKENDKSPEKTGDIPSQDMLDSPGGEGAMDHDEWLKDIGISPRSTLGFGRHATISDFSLHASLSNLSPDDASNGNLDSSVISEAARSTALITDPGSIHVFFNFMMTSKEFRATVGPQAGLPPTIVASDNFTNATSKSLTRTSQIVKCPGQSHKEYVFEMEGGPILPHVPGMVVNFLQSVPSLCTKDNKMKITVSGRHPYLGLNEAVHSDSFQNHTEFWFNPAESVFEI